MHPYFKFNYIIASLDAPENIEWCQNTEYRWVCFLSILKRDINYIGHGERHLILMRSYQHFLLTIFGNAMKNNVGETILHIHTTIQGRQLTRKTCLLFSRTLEASQGFIDMWINPPNIECVIPKSINS